MRRIDTTTIEARDKEIARAFHETYERLAPRFDYRTREASAVPWEDVPTANKALMISTVAELRRRGVLE